MFRLTRQSRWRRSPQFSLFPAVPVAHVILAWVLFGAKTYCSVSVTLNATFKPSVSPLLPASSREEHPVGFIKLP